MVSRVIQDAGLKVDADTMYNSRFLLQNGIPLNGKNLIYLGDLKELSGQMAKGKLTDDMMTPMCDAISEGDRPLDAMLISSYSLKGKAEQCEQVIQNAEETDLAYVIAEGQDLTIENLQVAEANRSNDADSDADTDIDIDIDRTVNNDTRAKVKQLVTEQGLALLTAKRQLEEVRLAMTSEANYALLKKGISIDTKPLVELVEDLKSQENEYYRALLSKGGFDTEENIAVFRQTDEVVRDLKTAPAYIIRPGDPDTLRSLHQEGMALKARFAKANESYETLMTSPNKDLGDSIQKAFRNVDDILKTEGMETSEANRRAVRILAYNRTELTPENISQVKAKDEQVQRAFTNLTPKVTMEMIKKGINPLDMDMNELNQAAEEIKSELGDEDTERYQKYLWKLEQNNAVTQEERSSYIGIYRLIAQVERADNAAIGSLMQQNVPITMRSLLTAVRTEEKKEFIDYRVDDSFEGTGNMVQGQKIDEQILAAYHRNCLHDAKEKLTPQAAERLGSQDYEEMSPEQVKEVVEQTSVEDQEEDSILEQKYFQQQLDDFAEALTVPEDIYAFLERADIPDTMYNLLAMRDMIEDRNRMFDTLWDADGATEDAMDQIEEMKAKILERFGEAVKSPEEMADAQEELADVAEHVMDTMIIESDKTGTLDLKALRLMSTQFSICAKQAKNESYMIPIQTSDGGVTGVSLKIVRGTKKKGMVDILFGSKGAGKVAATFEAKENGISGMLVSDNEETRKLLSERLGQLSEEIRGADGEQVDLRVAKVNAQDMTHYENNVVRRQAPEAFGTAQTEASGEDYHVQTVRLYQIAESFIRTVKEFV
jgi:hypothetical protein